MEQLAEVPDDIMESDEDYQIVISGWHVHIPELGLNLHEGVYCNYDGEEDGYLPDFAVTVVKEEGQDEWIYYEQDGFLITLQAFPRRLRNISFPQTRNAVCAAENW